MSSRALRRAPAPPPSDGRAGAILDAVLRVIAAEGAEAVTHRRVAAEAGVPLGSTTYYFASRDDLVREAFRRFVAQVFASLADLESALLRPTRASLVASIVEIERRDALDPQVMLVEYELIVRAARDPVLAAEFRAYERTLASKLAEALERLGAPQPFDAARTLIAIVRGFELGGLTGEADGPPDLARRLAPVVAALTARDASARAIASRRAARPQGRRSRRKEKT
jgi:DNA-binding transcriptional regulator YbjK